MKAALVALVLPLAALRGQDGPAVPWSVGVPAATPVAAVVALRDALGGAVDVRTAKAVRTAPPVGVQLLVFFDEWTLARLAAEDALAPLPSGASFELPFVDVCSVAAAVAAFPDASHTFTWEELALRPDLHDRLGLPAPEVDGGPWLAAMCAALGQSGREDAGIALWTTLDARAGRLVDDPAQLDAGLADGTFVVGLGGASRLLPWVERSGGRLRLHRLAGDPAIRLGVAVPRATAALGLPAAARLLVPERLAAVAAAARLRTAAGGGAPSLARDLARRTWDSFEQGVRGRGRAAERLADRLDLVFAVGFVVCALLLWRTLRTRPRTD